ncbi:MAG: hypothetical protein ABWX96_10815 [Propionibacteriaceae bacterium]
MKSITKRRLSSSDHQDGSLVPSSAGDGSAIVITGGRACIG